MKPNKKIIITKESILIMERSIRRNEDIKQGFKGCRHTIKPSKKLIIEIILKQYENSFYNSWKFG